MNIEEVKEILGLTRFIPVPQHVFITDEPVYEENNGRRYYRGLQPKSIRDVIFLPAHADLSTPYHENWHSVTGLGEFTAYPYGRFMAAKYRILKNFPAIAGLMRREVDYREVSPEEETEFPQISRFRGRVKHYVRVK